LIQNLTLARKRKLATGYVYISPEILEYSRVLGDLGIDPDQFISLAILVGTDFNPGGVHGIGPKKALALVKQKKYPVEIFREVEHLLEFNWQEVFEIFKKPNVHAGLKVSFPKRDSLRIKKILVDEHDFNLERVERQLEKLEEGKRKSSQQTLF